MRTITQGARANRNGRTAEVIIAGVITERVPNAVITKNAPVGYTIYGGSIAADRLVMGLPDYPDGLIIESKWQEVKGSADEKFPYLVLNIKECYPCPTIVIVAGGAARPGAVRWLRSQVGGRLLAVLTLEEFVTWCNRNL